MFKVKLSFKDSKNFASFNNYSIYKKFSSNEKKPSISSRFHDIYLKELSKLNEQKYVFIYQLIIHIKDNL